MIGMHGTKASNAAANKCDVFVAIGARFSDRVISDPKKFAKDAAYCILILTVVKLIRTLEHKHF